MAQCLIFILSCNNKNINKQEMLRVQYFSCHQGNIDLKKLYPRIKFQCAQKYLNKIIKKKKLLIQRFLMYFWIELQVIWLNN